MPVLQLLTTVLTLLTPVIAVVAQALTTYLVPVITTVVGVVTTVVNWFKNLAEQVFPAVSSAVSGASGPLAGLWQALTHLWDALRPLVTALLDLANRVFNTVLKPAIGPIGEALKEVARVIVAVLVVAINDVVIPAIHGLTDLLNGDANKAFKGYAESAKAAAQSIVESLGSLPARTVPVITQWSLRFGTIVGQLATTVGGAIRNMADAVVTGLTALGRKMVSTFSAVLPGMKSAGSAIIRAVLAGLNAIAPEAVWFVKTWVKGMVGMIGAARPALVSAGRALISGLLDGIRSMIPSLSGLLGSITSMIPSWKGPPKRDRTLLIPAGLAIMDGLNEGLERGWGNTKQVLGRITKHLEDAAGEMTKGTLGRASGPIIEISAKLAKALLGTADQIDAATKQIAAKIRDAFKAGAINRNDRDGMLEWLANSNAQLKKMSEARQKIVDKIKEIQDYAKQVTQNVLNYAAITNIKGDEGAASPTGTQLVAGLQARLATIREFGGNLKKLAGAGLSKALLRQILDAGIDGGAAIAAELANGPSSIIAALNTAQTSITKIAKDIGVDGADALFGSGKAMGDAFLKGLKSLEKTLTDAMTLLVEKLLKALGAGVDKAKGKLAEMVDASAKLAELANASGNYTPPTAKAPAAAIPKPAPPKAPVFQYIPPAGGGGSGIRSVVNFGGVVVHDKVDVDMLMNAASFASKTGRF